MAAFLSKLCNAQALSTWNTSDKSIYNNVHLISLQDTIYNGTGSTTCPSVMLMNSSTT